MDQTAYQATSPITVQELKGVNERKQYANNELGEFDYLRNVTFSRANALTKINGIKLLREGLGSPVLNIVQTNDSRRTIIIQCRDAVYSLTEDELFGTTPATNLYYPELNEEDVMPYALIVHKANSGVDGGGSTPALTARPLTDIVTQINSDGTAAAFCSLATNQITLQPGWYRIRGWVTASGAAADKLWGALYNTTAAANAWVGQANEYISPITPPVSGKNVRMFFAGVLNPLGVSTYELRQAGSVSVGGSGFGKAAGQAGIPELYASIEIIKTA